MIESLSGDCERLREQGKEGSTRIASLPLGGDEEAAQNAVMVGACRRATAQGQFAQNHTWSKRLLRLVVGRSDERMPNEGE